MVVVCCIGCYRFLSGTCRMGLFQALWSSCSKYPFLFLANPWILQAVETWYESLFRTVAKNTPSLHFPRRKKGPTDDEESGELVDKVKYS